MQRHSDAPLKEGFLRLPSSVCQLNLWWRHQMEIFSALLAFCPGPFVWGIHRSPVNFPHKGQWRGVLMFSLIWTWTNSWASNNDAGDLRRYHAHYDVIVRFTNNWGRDTITTICVSGPQWINIIYISFSLVRGHYVNLSKCTCILLFNSWLKNFDYILSRKYAKKIYPFHCNLRSVAASWITWSILRP